MLNLHFPSPISINEAETETATGALGHSASGGECALKHLVLHPTDPVMSPGQLVLGDGQREKWCLPQSLTSRSMVEKAYKTSGIVLPYQSRGKKDDVWDREGQESQKNLSLHPQIP